LKFACCAGFVVAGILGAYGAYLRDAEGSVGLVIASLMGFGWGTLLAQAPTEAPGRALRPPRLIAFWGYIAAARSLCLPLAAFTIGVLVGGEGALMFAIFAIAPSPVGGYCLAHIGVHYPGSRARRILAAGVLFKDRENE
jgi:hypothetical protein